MEKIIGRSNFEDFGITEEMYLNDTDWQNSYDKFATRYSLLSTQVQKMSRYLIHAEKKEKPVAEIKKAYMMLFNADNRNNPFYKMETIKVKDGYGISSYGKICVVDYNGYNVKINGIYEVIIPPMIVDTGHHPYNYTPCIVK